MRVVRDKIEEEFLVIYRKVEKITISLDVSPSVPRTVSRQMHRSNIPANTLEGYFNDHNQRASTLLTLIPSIRTKPDYHGETMADLIGLYRKDLPNPYIVDQELLLWKN